MPSWSVSMSPSRIPSPSVEALAGSSWYQVGGGGAFVAVALIGANVLPFGTHGFPLPGLQLVKSLLVPTNAQPLFGLGSVLASSIQFGIPSPSASFSSSENWPPCAAL